MKLESMFCGATWVLMNALLVMVAVEALPVSKPTHAAPGPDYRLIA